LATASFPVGNVDFLRLYPLSFAEFVEARASAHVSHAHRAAIVGDPLPTTAHHTLWDLWREYLVTGGMPEVIAAYIAKQPGSFDSLSTARAIQEKLITAYLADIAKHAGKVNAMHIERVWRSVPTQLASVVDQSTKRYAFKDVVPGIHTYGRLVGAIDWLTKAGLIIRVPICNHAELPISAFTKENHFKLYMFDIGLLGCMLSLPPATLLAYEFGTYKGYIAENLVAQELTASRQNASLLGWSEGTAEIEFLLQGPTSAVPVEVKSAGRIRAQSLRAFLTKYRPRTSVVISGRVQATKTDQTTGCLQANVPLYLVPATWNFIEA
jgi:predicted AAA+ superfamily ATPase